MKILITGIHGFIGSNLVKALRNSHTLYGLDIVFTERIGVVKTYSWNQMDIIPSVDVVIHLAGKAHDKGKANPKIYYETNTGLTKDIFNWFLKSEAKKFIFFSTVKAVADSTETKLSEYSIPFPKDSYGLSKYLAECYIMENIIPEKSVYIFRPCMIHGPGNKGNMNLLYKIQKNNFPWPLASFENKRSFCSVGNVSFVVNQIIEKDIPPGIYMLADDEPLSTNQIIRLIAESLNKKSTFWNIPTSIIRSLARIGDLLFLPFNSTRLKKLTESYIVSNKRLKDALQIERMPINAIEGLKITLESFSENSILNVDNR